jgi:hypothetical protein
VENSRHRLARIPLRPALALLLVAAALVAGALIILGGDDSPGTGGPSSASRATPTAATIPQPVPPDIQVAPDSARVDLAVPTFSDPTSISNPLFPVLSQESVLMLGHVDGKPFRTEVTLLPETRIIEWNGQQIEALVSQYAAFLGGRLNEVAYDYYAEDDDGAVWYLGEDVFDFAGGAIVSTDGTWLAGRDGPAAMIMPADPQVGDVYRTENVPGFAFEEVTVKDTGRPLDGPLGPVEGGIVVSELHMDGTREAKTFGPGYGEFLTGGGGDLEAMALAVPTDALGGQLPRELVNLADGGFSLTGEAGRGDWGAATATARRMERAWNAYPRDQVPENVRPRIRAAFDSLATALADRDPVRSGRSALDITQSGLDLQLLFRPAIEVDTARFDLAAARLALDASSGDANGARDDLFVLDYIRDRIGSSLPTADRITINLEIGELWSAIGDEDLFSAARHAGQLRAAISEVPNR